MTYEEIKALQEALQKEQEEKARLLKESEDKDLKIKSLTEAGSKLKKENDELITANGQLLLAQTSPIKKDDDTSEEKPKSIEDLANEF